MSDDFYSKATAGLSCGDDEIVSHDQVCRSSQYGVIEPKTTGSAGGGRCAGADKMQSMGANIPMLTLDISGYRTCNMDGPWITTPTHSTCSPKNRYLSVEKLKEIEDWLAEVNLGCDAGGLEADTGLPCKCSQNSWTSSILFRLGFCFE